MLENSDYKNLSILLLELEGEEKKSVILTELSPTRAKSQSKSIFMFKEAAKHGLGRK